jgi:hypothetical protein
MKRHAAPIIAAILLLLPVLYVGSYFALVVPEPAFYVSSLANGEKSRRFTGYQIYSAGCECFYWPLEQIDRTVRPGAWDGGLDAYIPSGPTVELDYVFRDSDFTTTTSQGEIRSKLWKNESSRNQE